MRQMLSACLMFLSKLRQLSLGYGLLAGGLLAAPLVGLLYLADKLAGLPFAPFALFDWIARVLPGPVVTFGIDLMIDGLRLAGLSVAAAAKTGEQTIAVLMFFLIGTAGGVLFFGINKARNSEPRLSCVRTNVIYPDKSSSTIERIHSSKLFQGIYPFVFISVFWQDHCSFGQTVKSFCLIEPNFC